MVARNKTRLAVVIGATALLAACAGDPESGRGPKENTGTLLGALGGAAIGSAFGGGASGHIAGALIGAGAGALIGNRIGAALDDEDKKRAYEAEMNALERGPSGAPVGWRNPDSGRYGSVVPGPAYRARAAAIAAPIPRPSTSMAARKPRAAPPAAIPTALGRR